MPSLSSEIERVSVPLLDLKAQYIAIREEVRAAIDRVVESQGFILGPEVAAFEKEIADYSRSAFAVGVSSGTDALLIALMAIGIKPNDEVITTPYSFFATAGSVARLGAKPVFVDIDPATCNLDPSGIEKAITRRTRAILPVHLYGQMAEMEPIMEIAARHDLFVVEDAAQAIGAEYRGRRAGSVGQVGCFSFYPSKNLGGFGDAGMVTTSNEKLAARLRLLRSHGHSRKYYNEIVGGNFRIDAIQAAVLRVKLKYLDQWTEQRRRNAATYCRLFAEAGLTDSDHVTLPHERGPGRHIYNQFVIRSKRRDDLIAFLKNRRIGCEIYYPVPLHLQACFAELGYQVGDLPASESAAHETLALPIYPELTEEMLGSVVAAIAEFHSGNSPAGEVG